MYKQNCSIYINESADRPTKQNNWLYMISQQFSHQKKRTIKVGLYFLYLW